jgi:hypothetical protein
MIGPPSEPESPALNRLLPCVQDNACPPHDEPVADSGRQAECQPRPFAFRQNRTSKIPPKQFFASYSGELAGASSPIPGPGKCINTGLMTTKNNELYCIKFYLLACLYDISNIIVTTNIV